MVHGTSEERWAKRQRATPPRLAPSQPPSMRQLAGDCPQATRLCAGGELTRGVLKIRRRHWCTAELTELRLAHWSRTNICGVWLWLWRWRLQRSAGWPQAARSCASVLTDMVGPKPPCVRRATKHGDRGWLAAAHAPWTLTSLHPFRVGGGATSADAGTF